MLFFRHRKPAAKGLLGLSELACRHIPRRQTEHERHHRRVLEWHARLGEAYQSPLIKRLRFRGLPERNVQTDQPEQVLRCHQMVHPERFFTDGQRALVKRLGLRELELIDIQLGKLVQRHGHIDVLQPEGVFLDGQFAPVQRLDQGKLPLIFIKSRQGLQDGNAGGMLRAKRAVVDCQRAHQEWRSVCAAVLVAKHLGQAVQSEEQIGMPGAQSLFLDRQHSL